MRPLAWRKENQSVWLKQFWAAKKHAKQLGLTLKSRNGFFVEIAGTNFGFQWLASSSDTAEAFEVFTNYTKDGSFQPMRKPFGGSMIDCINKAHGLTEYFKNESN